MGAWPMPAGWSRMAENRNIIPLIKNVTEAIDAEGLALEAARELIPPGLKVDLSREVVSPFQEEISTIIAKGL